MQIIKEHYDNEYLIDTMHYYLLIDIKYEKDEHSDDLYVKHYLIDVTEPSLYEPLNLKYYDDRVLEVYAKFDDREQGLKDKLTKIYDSGHMLYTKNLMGNEILNNLKDNIVINYEYGRLYGIDTKLYYKISIKDNDIIYGCYTTNINSNILKGEDADTTIMVSSNNTELDNLKIKLSTIDTDLSDTKLYGDAGIFNFRQEDDNVSILKKLIKKCKYADIVLSSCSSTEYFERWCNLLILDSIRTVTINLKAIKSVRPNYFEIPENVRNFELTHYFSAETIEFKDRCWVNVDIANPTKLSVLQTDKIVGSGNIKYLYGITIRKLTNKIDLIDLRGLEGNTKLKYVKFIGVHTIILNDGYDTCYLNNTEQFIDVNKLFSKQKPEYLKEEFKRSGNDNIEIVYYNKSYEEDSTEFEGDRDRLEHIFHRVATQEERSKYDLV